MQLNLKWKSKNKCTDNDNHEMHFCILMHVSYSINKLIIKLILDGCFSLCFFDILHVVLQVFLVLPNYFSTNGRGYFAFAKLLVNEDDDIILEQIRIIQSFLY